MDEVDLNKNALYYEECDNEPDQTTNTKEEKKQAEKKLWWLENRSPIWHEYGPRFNLSYVLETTISIAVLLSFLPLELTK